jgi:4-hydroxythreonine-4-phosphate dehydrogenase
LKSKLGKRYKSEKRVIGISLGDPAGIGPEILLKSLPALERIKNVVPLVIGDLPVVDRAANLLRSKVVLHRIKTADDIKKGVLNIYSPGIIKNEKFPVGTNNSLCGKASFTYVEESINLWKQNIIDALVTLPISKKSWNLAGKSYSGHTELLQEKLNARSCGMIMLAGKLRTILITTHISIKELLKNLSACLIVEKMTLANKFLTDTGIEKPVLAVAALNPHAGEEGLMGTEDEEIIRPAVRQLNRKGICCKGPVPSDAVFRHMKEGKLDMVGAIYHDQAMIPLKTFCFDRLVNYTAGIKMVRTSPGHGTGFDIVDKCKAKPESFISAYRMAVKMVKKGKAPFRGK